MLTIAFGCATYFKVVHDIVGSLGDLETVRSDRSWASFLAPTRCKMRPMTCIHSLGSAGTTDSPGAREDLPGD